MPDEEPRLAAVQAIGRVATCVALGLALGAWGCSDDSGGSGAPADAAADVVDGSQADTAEAVADSGPQDGHRSDVADAPDFPVDTAVDLPDTPLIDAPVDATDAAGEDTGPDTADLSEPDPQIEAEALLGPADDPEDPLTEETYGPPEPLATWMYLLVDTDFLDAIEAPLPEETLAELTAAADEASAEFMSLYLGVIPTSIAEAPFGFDLSTGADRTGELLAHPDFHPAVEGDSYSGVDLLLRDPFGDCATWHVEGLDFSAASDIAGGETTGGTCVEELFPALKGPSTAPPVVQQPAPGIPEGFKAVSGRTDLVEPDGSSLESGDPITPLRFWKRPARKPQASDGFTDADAYRWDAPIRQALSDTVTVWWQGVHVRNFTKNGRVYRGGEYRIQLKSTTPCENGRWIQLWRQTLRLGSSTSDLKTGYIDTTLGIAMPYETEPVPPEDGGWTVDRPDGGGPDKDPSYRRQHEGEMIDSPDRTFTSFQGFYSTRREPRTPAVVIQQFVEYAAFYVDGEGNVCDIVTYSFTTTWQKPSVDENDPAQARITSVFGAPTLVDKESDAGRALISEMRTHVERFRR